MYNEPQVPNLDAMSQEDLWAFWKRYTRPSRKDAAELIGRTTPGYTTLAARLACYASNKATAMSCRLSGDILAAMVYEDICEKIYQRLPEYLRW